jgi:regulatory protein
MVNFGTNQTRRSGKVRPPKNRRLDRAGLWDYALKALAGRACSTAEIRQKLEGRADRPEDVDGVMSQLRDYGYLDDQRFAEGFAAARLENQKLGRTRVVRDLRRRRVAPALAERTAGKVYEHVDETALIEEWVRRKYRLAPRDGLFREDKDMAAAYRRLLHAGFRSGDILKVLKRFARNPDLLDGLEPPEEPLEDE